MNAFPHEAVVMDVYNMLDVQKDVWGACTVGYILGKTSPHSDFVTFTWRRIFERLFIFATQKVVTAVPFHQYPALGRQSKDGI
jgi:hypothetical protein